MRILFIAQEVGNIGPANDFYKRLALECSGHQVAIDLIMINSVYADVATLCKLICSFTILIIFLQLPTLIL